MSEEKSFNPPKSLDDPTSIETTIAHKVEHIQSQFASSKQNITEEDVECFIRELTGCMEVLKMSSSEQTNVLLGNVIDLVQELTQFQCDLKKTRQVRSKIIDMEMEVLKNQATWRKLPVHDLILQGNKIHIIISRVINTIKEMQNCVQYKKRLEELSKNCLQLLQEIEKTIYNLKTFNIQYPILQKEHEAILQNVKSSKDIGKALLDLEQIKFRAENLPEIRDKRRYDMINSVKEDIEKFTNILENSKLQEFAAMWHQVEHDLNTKSYTADYLNNALTVLNEIRNSIDISIKVFKRKTGNLYDEDAFQRKFNDIKSMVRVATSEDDGSQFLQFANDLRKLHSQITDHQSLMKEIYNYAATLENEANNFNFLHGIEAKTNEIDDLLATNVTVDEIQVILENLKSILLHNSFKTSLSKSVKRRSNLLDRIKNQEFKLEQLKVKTRQEYINAEDILGETKNMLQMLEPQVRSFVGTTNENYSQLNELITRYTLQLDGIKVQNDEIQIKKVNLLKTFHELADVLENRRTAVELVDDLDTRVADTLIFLKHTNILTEKQQLGQIVATFDELQKQRALIPNIGELKEKLTNCDQNLDLLERLIAKAGESDSL